MERDNWKRQSSSWVPSHSVTMKKKPWLVHDVWSEYECNQDIYPTLRTTQNHQFLTASEQHLWSDPIHCSVPYKNGWVVTGVEESWAACKWVWCVTESLSVSQTAHHYLYWGWFESQPNIWTMMPQTVDTVCIIRTDVVQKYNTEAGVWNVNKEVFIQSTRKLPLSPVSLIFIK